MDAFNAELKRTAFQKKAVVKLTPDEVLEAGIAFFKDRGYRSARTGRPGHIFVMGGAEGVLPRVTGEISARKDVGKAGTTLVTLDSSGERLGQAMAAFLAELRARNRQRRDELQASSV
jgi:hypothetical protein